MPVGANSTRLKADTQQAADHIWLTADVFDASSRYKSSVSEDCIQQYTPYLMQQALETQAKGAGALQTKTLCKPSTLSAL